jgi:hypothetical protein
VSDDFVFPQDHTTRFQDGDPIEVVSPKYRREGGLTKRELFAAMVLEKTWVGGPDAIAPSVAFAVTVADALIAALEAQKKPHA